MRVERGLAGVVLAMALASASCHSPNPVGPAAVLDGVWTGSIVDSVAGSGTAVLSMSQTGSGVAGNWSATFADPAFNREGSIGGTRRGSAVSLFLTPGAPLVCSPTTTLSGTLGVTGTVTENQLRGTYVVFTCNGPAGGRLDVKRQGN